ncbi:MAG: hypothetical protein U9O85_07580 [Euryarchaeota archaeon]|nr:hypothetical protein [Euryarchaeota archaeon]
MHYEPWVVVLLNKIVEKRCAGKMGWERQECVTDLRHRIFNWNERPIWLSLFDLLNYLYKQLELQEDIHDRSYNYDLIIESLDELERWGYPNEKIERIRREFDRPISERHCDAALREYLGQILSDP